MPYRNPFERLGLDADAGADAKSIRRAYPRELKLIDQELDPAGFQALREAYEAALTWTAPHEPPIPGTHSIPAAPTTMQGADTTEQVALAAMRDFRTAAAQLAAGQASRPSQWERMHRALLDDERLFNLQARDLFEAHIARLLVSGWQPGHEMIFAVSSQVFQWESDPLRLHQLGNAGAVLDQALDEQVRLHSLGDTDVHWAYAILDALRKNTPVTDHQLRNDMAQLDRMVTCLPTWMDIMVDPDAVRRWEARFCTLPPVKKLPWMHWDLRPLGYFLLAAMAVYLLFFPGVAPHRQQRYFPDTGKCRTSGATAARVAATARHPHGGIPDACAPARRAPGRFHRPARCAGPCAQHYHAPHQRQRRL